MAASTDLSAAYNTVNHKILLKKLEYYGVTGTELELFKSYLSNRKQYADINTKKSDMIYCLDCGVIQGSKLSGLLYTIYTNEVSILHEVLENEEICETIGAKHYPELPVQHDVVNPNTFEVISSYWKYITIARSLKLTLIKHNSWCVQCPDS